MTLLIAKLVLFLSIMASGYAHGASPALRLPTSPNSPPVLAPLDSPVANPQPPGNGP